MSDQLERELRSLLHELALCADAPTTWWDGAVGPVGTTQAKYDPGDIIGRFADDFAAATTDRSREKVVDAARAYVAALRGTDHRSHVEGETDDELRERIVRDGLGLSVADACIAFGVGPRFLCAARRSRGREPDFGRVPLSIADVNARRERSLALKAEGYTIAQIARMLGISRSTAERDLGLRGARSSKPAPIPPSGSATLSAPRPEGEVSPQVDRQGFVYFARAILDPPIIKIGWTTQRDVEHRLSALRSRTGWRIELIGYFAGLPRDERVLHRLFAAHRVHGREWYEATPELMAIAESHAAALDGDVHRAHEDQTQAVATGRR